MTNKAPLPLRLFHYALWTIMFFVLMWLFIVPLFFKVTAPKPLATEQPSGAETSLELPLKISDNEWSAAKLHSSVETA